MRGNKAVVGVFQYMDDFIGAIQKVKAAKLDYRVYSPMCSHEIEEATLPERSPVRFFTFTGGLIGCISGFSLAILCSMDYPLRVSAKDIVSVPGFVVIGYECTILFGAIATLISLLHFCRLPDIFRKVGYDERFSIDRFGLVVGCDGKQAEEVKKTLLGAGAEEAEVKDGL